MHHFSTIGEALRCLRKERGLKQAEVAKVAGITSPMLSAYETGKQRPSFATIDKILRALDADARDLTSALLAADAPSGEPTAEAASSEARANLEAITAVELQIRNLVEEMGEDLTPMERSILSRSGITFLWLLRHLQRKE